MFKYFSLIIFICLLICAVYVYFVGRPLRLKRDTALAFEMPDDFRDILYYASTAPSGHNVQPWEVRYSAGDRSFTLSLDRSRSLPQVDPDNREALISLGAFLENWSQAAEAYGYTAEISILPEPGVNMEVARVALSGSGQKPADAEMRLARILARHTDKRAYEDRVIPEASIAAALERNRPYLHFFPKGAPEFIWLADRAAQAMEAQAAHEGKRIELAEWMRFSNAEAILNKDGLPAEQLGMSWPLKAAFYTFFNRKSASSASFALQAVKLTREQLAGAAGFFVVTGPADFQGTLQAGMNFERAWLDAVDLGISIHPMSQILEEEPFAGEVTQALNLDSSVQMILRAGMNAEYGQNNGIRRDIGSFTRPEE